MSEEPAAAEPAEGGVAPEEEEANKEVQFEKGARLSQHQHQVGARNVPDLFCGLG